MSLLFDGLVTPAVAARYAGQTETARPLFVLITSIVRFVMPISLGFQALSVFCWGAAMLACGLRFSGAITFVLGLALIAAVGVGENDLTHRVALWAAMSLYRRGQAPLVGQSPTSLPTAGIPADAAFGRSTDAAYS